MTIYDLLADIALTRIQNPTAKIVLLSLASYCNSAGECWPSQRTIAEDSCMTDRSVRNAIAWLVEHGYLEVRSRPNQSNIYIITAMKDEDMDHEEKFSYEVDSNITKLDLSKKAKSNLTSSAEKSSARRDSPLFLAFWQAYPRKIGKAPSRVAFSKAIKKADPNQIIQAAIAYSNHCDEMGIEIQYRPHPKTWLNQERWEDDLEAEKQEVTQVKNHDWLNEL